MRMKEVIEMSAVPNIFRFLCFSFWRQSCCHANNCSVSFLIRWEGSGIKTSGKATLFLLWTHPLLSPSQRSYLRIISTMRSSSAIALLTLAGAASASKRGLAWPWCMYPPLLYPILGSKFSYQSMRTLTSTPVSSPMVEKWHGCTTGKLGDQPRHRESFEFPLFGSLPQSTDILFLILNWH